MHIKAREIITCEPAQFLVSPQSKFLFLYQVLFLFQVFFCSKFFFLFQVFFSVPSCFFLFQVVFCSKSVISCSKSFFLFQDFLFPVFVGHRRRKGAGEKKTRGRLGRKKKKGMLISNKKMISMDTSKLIPY